MLVKEFAPVFAGLPEEVYRTKGIKPIHRAFTGIKVCRMDMDWSDLGTYQEIQEMNWAKFAGGALDFAA